MQMHSHDFQTGYFQKFFEKLQQIAPKYLTWSESAGKLICQQQPVDDSLPKSTLNTVENVMKKLKLVINPNDHKVTENKDGTTTHEFSVKGIYDQLKRNEWVMKHIDDAIKAASENRQTGNRMR